MAKVESTTQNSPAARGQTIVTSRMPVRDSGSDVGKTPRSVKGSDDSLSHSIEGNKVVSK